MRYGTRLCRGWREGSVQLLTGGGRRVSQPTATLSLAILKPSWSASQTNERFCQGVLSTKCANFWIYLNNFQLKIQRLRRLFLIHVYVCRFSINKFKNSSGVSEDLENLNLVTRVFWLLKVLSFWFCNYNNYKIYLYILLISNDAFIRFYTFHIYNIKFV